MGILINYSRDHKLAGGAGCHMGNALNFLGSEKAHVCYRKLNMNFTQKQKHELKASQKNLSTIVIEEFRTKKSISNPHIQHL